MHQNWTSALCTEHVTRPTGEYGYCSFFSLDYPPANSCHDRSWIDRTNNMYYSNVNGPRRSHRGTCITSWECLWPFVPITRVWHLRMRIFSCCAGPRIESRFFYLWGHSHDHIRQCTCCIWPPFSFSPLIQFEFQIASCEQSDTTCYIFVCAVLHVYGVKYGDQECAGVISGAKQKLHYPHRKGAVWHWVSQKGISKGTCF